VTVAVTSPPLLGGEHLLLHLLRLLHQLLHVRLGWHPLSPW
jgi:hypothetical protein